jgi:hypothetical protein
MLIIQAGHRSLRHVSGNALLHQLTTDERCTTRPVSLPALSPERSERSIVQEPVLLKPPHRFLDRLRRETGGQSASHLLAAAGPVGQEAKRRLIGALGFTDVLLSGHC